MPGFFVVNPQLFPAFEHVELDAAKVGCGIDVPDRRYTATLIK